MVPASTIRLDEKPLRRFHRVEWCPEKASLGSAPKGKVSAFRLAHGRPSDEKPLRRFHRVEWCPEKASMGSAPKGIVSAIHLAHGRPTHDTINMPWFVYILRCSDLSYYVGHTENPQQRVITHNAGRGPVYTSRRRPVELVHYEQMPSKAAAVQREKQIKKWSRSKKKALVAGNSVALEGLSRCRKKKPSSA